MPRFARMPKGEGPVPTFLCHNRAEVTRALAQIRKHLGISQLELDELAGFATGYTGKLEALGAPGYPNKRTGARSAFHPMMDYWLGALGVGIVVVPLVGGADNVPRAIRPPIKPAKMTLKRAKRVLALWQTNHYSRPRLAEKFGCSLSTICEITEGRYSGAGPRR